jgi:hypothetical protein
VTRLVRPAALPAVLVVAAATAAAEPMFLSRQHARCGSCHYSPTGGGLLTDYGRALSHAELSTTGDRSAAGPEAGSRGEEAFLWGALGGALGPVSLGVDLRPAHLDVRADSFHETRTFMMSAAFQAAFRAGGWTVYADAGRQGREDGAEYASYEHWVERATEKGLAVRVGRFLPAYGVRFADHTSFNRRSLGLDTDDQIYGAELRLAGARHLVQVAVGPGRAEALFDEEDEGAWTASARGQWDLGGRAVLVGSALYRGETALEPQSGSAGLAVGFAPASRLSVWTEADAQWREGTSGAPAWIVVNETAFEAVRGLWLKLTPQLLTEAGDTSAGVVRLGLAVDFLPRTHWNVGLSFYRDRERRSGLVTKTLLAQLHLYL